MMSRLVVRRPHGWGLALTLVGLLTLVLSPSTSSWAQKKRKRPATSKPAKRSNQRRGLADPKQSDLATPGSASKDADARAKVRKGEKGSTQVFDFSQLNFSGSERKPQLLYFLDRAQEELERASLERRSFMPELVRSVEDGTL